MTRVVTIVIVVKAVTEEGGTVTELWLKTGIPLRVHDSDGLCVGHGFFGLRPCLLPPPGSSDVLAPCSNPA